MSTGNLNTIRFENTGLGGGNSRLIKIGRKPGQLEPVGLIGILQNNNDMLFTGKVIFNPADPSLLSIPVCLKEVRYFENLATTTQIVNSQSRNSANFIAFKSPDVLADNVTYTLPTIGSLNQHLTINSISSTPTGVDAILQWSTAGGNVNSVIDFTVDNSLIRVDLPSGVKSVQQSLVALDDLGSLTGLTHIDLEHTAIESNDHAIEIDVNAAGFGDVKALDIVYITGAISAGSDEECILINVDETSSGALSRVVGLEVLTTDQGSAEVDAIAAGVGVHPIVQQSGVFGDANVILVLAVDQTVALSSGGAGNIAVFVADNDTVTITNATKFGEIEFIMDTFSSGAGIQPLFEFSDGATPTTWQSFSPADGTNGFRNNGAIAWSLASIPTWVIATSGDFEIRITRQRNALTTNPIMDLIQIAGVDGFTWDKNGDLIINVLTTNDNVIINEVNSGSNTKYGFRAGTVITSGTQNTLVGEDAGLVLINASDNTGIGYQAMDLLVSGSENTAIGSCALNQAITASDCVAVGFFAVGNSNRSRQTGIGYEALRFSAGDDQTACGYKSLKESDGDNSVGIGSFALMGINGASSGNDNVAVGYESSFKFETATQNVSVGNFTLRDIVDGADNVAVGFNAGKDVTEGKDNTFVGSASATLLTTGSNNIALGNDSGSAWTVGDSDNIAIGNIGVLGDSGEIRIGTSATHVKNFQQGIRGITTDNVDAVAVLVDSVGQLGTVSSSLKYKQNIKNMKSVKKIFKAMRPVQFNYICSDPEMESKNCKHRNYMNYGLIAEELVEILPELVIYDNEKPDTIQYQKLTGFFIKAIQELYSISSKLEDEILTLKSVF